MAYFGVKERHLVRRISLNDLPSELCGLIVGYCELQHVALLFCCGSRILNTKLTSRAGSPLIRSSRLSRRDWTRLPAFLGQLTGLKSFSLEFVVLPTSIASLWSYVTKLLPISMETLSLTMLGITTDVDMDLLHSRLPFLKSLSVSFKDSSRGIITPSFPFLADWSHSSLSKLVLDFRFLVPPNQLFALPSTLTDLTWGGECEDIPQTADLVWFSGFERLSRLCIPFADQLVMDTPKPWFPMTLTTLELPYVVKVRLLGERDDSIILTSDEFSAMLPPSLVHFESADVVNWTFAPCLKTVTSWKLRKELVGEILTFPENIQALVVVAKRASLNSASPSWRNLLERLPATITDLQVPHLPFKNFNSISLPPCLTHFSMAWNLAIPFEAKLPTSLTTLHLETAPTQALFESTGIGVVELVPLLPPHITRFSTPASICMRLSQNDNTAMKWKKDLNWISPFLVVVSDRIDLMYECFERGWYHESHFEKINILLEAIKHGSLKFLKWAITRRFMASYHLSNPRRRPNNGLLITTALVSGRMDVIAMFEANGLDTSFQPTASVISGAISSNNPEILAWMTKRGVDFANVSLPNLSPLTVALYSCSRASAEYLMSVGCVAVDHAPLCMKEASLDLAQELGL